MENNNDWGPEGPPFDLKGIMMEPLTINSPIFGRSIIPNPDEMEIIAQTVVRSPVAVFQLLNKKLNKLGMCISIEILPTNGDPVCVYREDENGPWKTDCNYDFEFIEGGPFDNGWVFCPKCGKPMKEITWQEPPLEEDE